MELKSCTNENLIEYLTDALLAKGYDGQPIKSIEPSYYSDRDKRIEEYKKEILLRMFFSPLAVNTVPKEKLC